MRCVICNSSYNSCNDDHGQINVTSTGLRKRNQMTGSTCTICAIPFINNHEYKTGVCDACNEV